MFQMDVVKVDRDVSYVAMVVLVCCNNNVSSVFSEVFCECVYVDVAYVFTHMLQVFYLDVVYVLHGFQVFFRCFCKCFRCMF